MFAIMLESIKVFWIVHLCLVRKSQAIDSMLYFLGCQLFDLLSRKRFPNGSLKTILLLLLQKMHCAVLPPFDTFGAFVALFQPVRVQYHIDPYIRYIFRKIHQIGLSPFPKMP